MTNNPLNSPWSLHFDRDGTEDYGIICDAEGNDLVASHLPQTNMPRWKDREFGEGCFWLPEEEGDPVPYLVRVMQLMTAAPKLLAMLKVAIATADPAKHKWVKEAWDVIAEATGQPFNATEGHTHLAAPRMYAALKKCETMLREYKQLAEARAVYFGVETGHVSSQIEAVRQKAATALAEARGD